MTDEELDRRFDHHPPTGGKVNAHQDLRAAFKIMAHCINTLVPTSREQSVAFTALEESMFWSNAGIARNPQQ